jgi:hypothetical protein
MVPHHYAIRALVVGLVLAAPTSALAESGAASEGPDNATPTRGEPILPDQSVLPAPQPDVVPSHLPCIPSDTRSACPHARRKVHDPRASRVVLESVVGFGSEIGLGIAGLLVGVGLCTDRDGWLACVGEAAVGMLVGGTAGAVGGVYLTGNGMGGDGKFVPTLLGGVGGTAVGVAGVAALAESSTGAATVWFLAAPVTGAVLGYELSSSSSAEPRRLAVRSLRISGVPTKTGGVLALHGQF